ncbi:hypothetical protein CASFOL_016710 [Castilleja foliolosa]|uniref:Pentatricopeptide repeat-containing protein n=1 Tax=Castilleja foliolosa TaxID=1961234 RepID=A0ABD3D901_9LAMI
MHQKIPITHPFFSSSSSSYLELIDIYTRNRALKPGKSLHSHLIINALANSPHFASKLISLYTACKQLNVAQKVFDEIPKSNIRGWVAFIGSCARNSYYQETISAFSDMLKHGFNHDKIVLPSVLKACGHLNDRNTGQKLHAVVVKNGFVSDPFVSCSLIDMYSKCGIVIDAEKVFDEMPERDLVSLNTMVSGFVHNGSVKEAMCLVEKMKLSGFRPDIVTWNLLISGFSQANDEAMVAKIFEIMDVKPDVVSFTSVISGFIQNFQSPKAYSVFRQMLKVCLFPTASTISALLPGPANTANLRCGKEIHGYSIVIGLDKDIYVKSALIDMYAKCGSISEAMLIFQKMPERNTVTWNSMIFGYANHGYCNEAIGLFYKMLEKDEKKLDHLSFTAGLTACAHAGMVDLGKGLFEMMREKYGIVPRVEHYVCMVDLLGRTGKVQEAYDVICKMPVEPDLFVWGALLGACKRYGFVDLAEMAAGKLAKLEPKSSGSSVALVSLYADSSRWGNATELKRTMKKRKLRSYPSRSWIEVL